MTAVRGNNPMYPAPKLGFGGAVSRDPSAQCSRRNACSGRLLSGQALADGAGPVVGDSEILLARMKELMRDLLACGEFGILGRLRESTLFDK